MSAWLPGSSPPTRPFATVPESVGRSLFPLLVVTALRDEAVAFCRGVGSLCRPMSFVQAERGLRRGSLTGGTFLPVVYLGPGPQGVKNLERLISGGEKGPILFCGFAGGLSPELKSGEVLVASLVMRPGEKAGSVPVPDFLPPRYRKGTFVTVDRPVASSREKAVLRAQTGGDAVDMESAGWLSCAERHGIEAWTVRVVSDAAEESLHAEAMSFVDDRGETSLGTVLGTIFLHPAVLISLLRLFPGIRRAHAALGDLGRTISGQAGSRIPSDKGFRRGSD